MNLLSLWTTCWLHNVMTSRMKLFCPIWSSIHLAFNVLSLIKHKIFSICFHVNIIDYIYIWGIRRVSTLKWNHHQYKTIREKSLFNVDMTTDCNVATLPAELDRQSAFIVGGEFHAHWQTKLHRESELYRGPIWTLMVCWLYSHYIVHFLIMIN